MKPCCRAFGILSSRLRESRTFPVAAAAPQGKHGKLCFPQGQKWPAVVGSCRGVRSCQDWVVSSKFATEPMPAQARLPTSQVRCALGPAPPRALDFPTPDTHENESNQFLAPELNISHQPLV